MATVPPVAVATFCYLGSFPEFRWRFTPGFSSAAPTVLSNMAQPCVPFGQHALKRWAISRAKER
jgi:hypothetical protein